MKEYLKRSGQSQSAGELEDLCMRLEQTSTDEKVDAITDLLDNLAGLQLQTPR